MSSYSKYFFRNQLPKTTQTSSGYFRFGHNDNLPLELIEAINNCGVAKKAAKKYAEFIQADGFADKRASYIQVNPHEYADRLLSTIALSFSYFSSCALHIKRKGDGSIGSVSVMPVQKLRRGLNGTWFYNETIGGKYDKKCWVELQDFQGQKVDASVLAENIQKFGGRGEVFYMFDGNPFDSSVYAIPDYYASIEDLKTCSEISKMDLESVLNGFVLGGVMSFFDVDDTTKGEDGLTDRERTDLAMTQFTGLQKNADGLSSRFGIMTHYTKTKDQAPIYTANDPKPILEASNAKRDIIERAVCRLWGVQPVLIGYSEASILGNDKAISQAVDMLTKTVNPVQRLITDSLKKIYGSDINFTISEFKPTQTTP